MIIVALYATTLDLVIRQYKLGKQTRKVLWAAYVVFSLFIGFGRIYNGVHTYNQVIAGYAWGVCIYYTFAHILYFDVCRFISRIPSKTIGQLVWNPFTQTFIGGYILAIILYLYGSTYHPTPQIWLDNIQKNCVNVDLNADPELQNFEKYNISFSLIGALLGIILEQRYLDTRHYHLFYRTSFLTTLLRFLVGSIFGIIPLLPYLVSKHNPFWIVLLCKSILPTLLGNIHVYGTQKWIAHKFGLINTDKIEKSILEREYFVEDESKTLKKER